MTVAELKTANQHKLSHRDQIGTFCDEATNLWMNRHAKKSVDKQRNISNGTSVPQRRHTCSFRCMNTNVQFYVFKTPTNALHICLKEAMQTASTCVLGGRPEDHTECMFHVEHLWVCKRTGKYHICGVHCDEIFKNHEDNTDINKIGQSETTKCPITGMWIRTRRDGFHEFYAVASAKVDEARMLQWMTTAVEKWRAICRDWAPVDHNLHVCRTGEEISLDSDSHPSRDDANETTRIMKGTIPNKKQKTTSEKLNTMKDNGSCQIIKINAYVYSVANDTEFHVCLGMHCKDREFNDNLHITTPTPVDDLYVCRATGKPHYCGPYCKESVRNHDGISVCMLTGRCLADPLIRDSWVVNGKQITSDRDNSACGQEEQFTPFFSKKRSFQAGTHIDKESVFNLNGGVDPFDGRGIGTAKKKIDASNKKEELMIIAIDKIMKLFSDSQKAKDTEKAQTIQQDMENQLNRYINRKTQYKSLIVLTDIFTLHENHQNNKDDVVVFTLSDQQKRNLATLYAQQCIKLWYIVRTKTNLGITRPNLFPFKDFVYPAISLFESGFEIPETDLGFRAIIIEEDELFKAKSPDIDSSAFYANTQNDTPQGSPGQKKRRKMNNYTSQIPKLRTKHEMNNTRRKSQYDKIRKSIEEALTSAVRNDSVSPECLRLSTVDYEAIDPSDEVFKYTNHRGNSTALLTAKKQDLLMSITSSVPQAITNTYEISHASLTVPTLPSIPALPYGALPASVSKRITNTDSNGKGVAQLTYYPPATNVQYIGMQYERVTVVE